MLTIDVARSAHTCTVVAQVCVCVCVYDLFSYRESFNFAEESHFSAFKECIPVGIVQHFRFCTNYILLLLCTNLVSFSRYFSFNSYVRYVYIGYMMHFSQLIYFIFNL